MVEIEPVIAIIGDLMHSYVLKENHQYAVTVREGLLHVDCGVYPITRSSITDYVRKGLPLEMIKQQRNRIRIMEVGVALSEFVPWFAGIAEVRPVAVCPDNYPVMELLCSTVAESEQETPEFRTTARLLAERARIMGSDKVELINTTFKDAIRGGLLRGREGQFNVVINVAAADYYSPDWEKASKDLLSFLAPGGVYVSAEGRINIGQAL